MEYIEREAAIAAIKNLYPGIPLAKIRLQKWHEENKSFMECERAIERIPAADVAPVRHGRWKLGICQECLFDWSEVSLFANVPKYCPNCGARMDGSEEVR